MTNPYIEEGYPNRKAYLHGIAEQFGVDYSTVAMLADILGESEDFDGLITSIEDAESDGSYLFGD